jgi:hypothetical protein
MSAFAPERDAFAYSNELRWTYSFDSAGNATTHKTDPIPEYSLRCFPMARAAREFFYHAKFAPDLPKAAESEYDRLVSEVLGRSSRCPSREQDRIVIPGFTNLHEFSAAFPKILKDQCGGAVRSFFQRGNWRMVFPVTHRQEQKIAREFSRELSAGRIPIAHVYQFPNTTLNHAILIYAERPSEDGTTFVAYDPNNPDQPAELTFDERKRTFLFERNQYFGGGAVKVYEVYHGLFY